MCPLELPTAQRPKCSRVRRFDILQIEICDNRKQESAQIMLQTPWHLMKAQINLISLYRRLVHRCKDRPNDAVCLQLLFIETPLSCINMVLHNNFQFFYYKCGEEKESGIP